MTAQLPPIAEWQDVTPGSFAGEIVPRGAPAVLRGLVRDWPAVAESRGSGDAARAYLAGLDRGGPVEAFIAPAQARGRYFYADDMRGFNFERRKGTIAEILRFLGTIEGRDGAPSVYVGSAPIPEQMPDFQTLVVRASLRELLEERNTALILRDVLPGYLVRRRWFASKHKRVDGVRIAYAATLPTNHEIILTEIEVDLGDGAERYFIPAGIAWESRAMPPLAQQLAVARVRRGRSVGFITDAFGLEAFPHAILACFRAGETIAARDGELRFEAGSLIATPAGRLVLDRLTAELAATEAG